MTQLAPAHLKDLGTIARIQAEAFTRDSTKQTTSIGEVAAAFIVFFHPGFLCHPQQIPLHERRRGRGRQSQEEHI